jgi:hypothetical protein
MKEFSSVYRGLMQVEVLAAARRDSPNPAQEMEWGCTERLLPECLRYIRCQNRDSSTSILEDVFEFDEYDRSFFN